MEGFTQETYDSIIKKEINPVVFYHEYFEAIDKGSQEYSDTAISLHMVEALTDSRKDFFDETGNRVTAYAIQNSSANLQPPERGGTFNQINYVFCFASTFDYFSNSTDLDDDGFISALFDLQFGDVSYEEVYRDGQLAVQDTIKFFDGNGDMYEKTPLQAIDASVHKTEEIDHDYIKDNIER